MEIAPGKTNSTDCDKKAFTLNHVLKSVNNAVRSVQRAWHASKTRGFNSIYSQMAVWSPSCWWCCYVASKQGGSYITYLFCRVLFTQILRPVRFYVVVYLHWEDILSSGYSTDKNMKLMDHNTDAMQDSKSASNVKDLKSFLIPGNVHWQFV